MSTPCPKAGSVRCRPPCRYCYGGSATAGEMLKAIGSTKESAEAAQKLLVDLGLLDDDWDDEDETPLEPTQPHAASAETAPVNDLLLELITALPRLAVLLSEADEAEFKAAAPRLKAFLALVDAVPRQPTAGKVMGFKAPAKKIRRKK